MEEFFELLEAGELDRSSVPVPRFTAIGHDCPEYIFGFDNFACVFMDIFSGLLV